jgi:hypothetical protein
MNCHENIGTAEKKLELLRSAGGILERCAEA